MSRYIVFDSHCDTAYELWRKGHSIADTDCHVTLTKAKRLAGYAQFFAFCTLAGNSGSYDCEALFRLPYDYFRRQLEAHSDSIELCVNGTQLEQTLQRGKIAAFFSMEGAEGISCDPGRLEELAQMGVRMVNLTWNADNELAGCAKNDGPGLSHQGREFVRRAQSLGIIVDVSHISDRAFWDVLDVAEKPVVASHSNSRSMCGHCRNLTDEQFIALCQTGGYAGINLYSDFLTENGKANFDTVRIHMDHFLQLGGERHLAIGGDLDGCDTLPNGFAGVDDYDKLASFLKNAGFSEETLQEIFSNTMKRIVNLCTI